MNYNFNTTIFGKDWKKMLETYGCKKNFVIYVKRNDNFNKFYVGLTKNYNKRYKNNFLNNFCYHHNITQDWLQFPIPKYLDNHQAELYIFSAIANEFGEDNVRGAHLTTMKLPKINVINGNFFLNFFPTSTNFMIC